MNSLIDNNLLPKNSIVVEEFKKMIGGAQLRRKIEKRRKLELAKLIVKNDDYSEIAYDINQHDKALVGLYSR
jgi:hypothetical protein